MTGDTYTGDVEETLTQDRQAAIAHARATDELVAAEWAKYWAHPWHAAVAAARQADKDARNGLHYTNRAIYERRAAAAKVAHEKADALKAGAQEAMQAAVDFDRSVYGGWQRFFQVIHLHASMYCHSFRATTQVGWLPDLSGLTEAEAVAKYGAILCTHCFPSAPVEWTKGPDAAPDACPGAGKYVKSVEGGRHGYYGGNYAICPDCGKQVGYNRNSTKIPKHKKG